MRVAVAGEDEKFCEQLSGLLAGQGHEVARICRVGRAMEALREARPGLLVIVKPFFHEALVSFLRSVREEPALRGMPILCVNPKGTSAEGVAELDAGADDFMNRPFNSQIFLARVRVLLRRAAQGAPADERTVLESGPVVMRLLSRGVELAGEPVALTRLEFDLLAFLLRAPRRVFSRQDILEAVWNYPVDVETRTLDKHVETLRRKLGPAGPCIQTVRGMGYGFFPPASPSSSRR